MPSGNWLPNTSAPIRWSRGDGPSGANSGVLNGPKINPMNTATTAADWMKRRRVLIFRVLSLDSLRMSTAPMTTIAMNMGTTISGEFSVTADNFFYLLTLTAIIVAAATVAATTAKAVMATECRRIKGVLLSSGRLRT